MKSVAHLVEAQAPLNWKQLERLGLAIVPVDSLGRFDERGNEYELGNELLRYCRYAKSRCRSSKIF